VRERERDPMDCIYSSLHK